MGFFLTVLCVFFVYISPAETFPFLIPFRPVLLLTIIGGVASFLIIASNPAVFRVPQIGLMLLLTGLILLSWPAHGWLGGIIPTAQAFLPSAIVFFLVLANVQTTARVRWLALTFLLVSAYFGIRGILAFYYGHGLEEFTVPQGYYTLDPATGEETRGFFLRIRGLGIIRDPNDLAQNFLVCLPFLGLAWRKRNPLWNFVSVILPGAFFLFVVYLTGSRGSLVGIFVLVALLLQPKLGLGGPVASAVFSAFLLFAIGFGGGRAISISGGGSSGRLDIWSEAFALVRSNPLRGVGFNGITEYTKYTAHNSFLLCATELGLPGYFLWLAIVVLTIFQLRQVLAQSDPGFQTQQLKRVANCTILALYTFLTTSWFLSRTYIITPFLLFGLGAAIYLMARNQGLLKDPVRQPGWVRTTLYGMLGTLATIYIMVRIRWLSG